VDTLKYLSDFRMTTPERLQSFAAMLLKDAD
jgi:hypothetical protein